MNIGVIGIGTVGKPLYNALKYYHETVYAYDIKKEYDFWTRMLECDTVFICVPTDQHQKGRLNMNHVDGILNRLQDDGFKGLAVIKSTLGLGYINKKIDESNFDIAVFPEWLRAVNALPGTLKPEMSVIGIKNRSKIIGDEVLKACVWHKNTVNHIVLPEEAVMIKLTANALASTKISFANQIHLICKEYNIDAKNVMDLIKKDPRCSPRYLTPGKSFGGHCLIKDTSELSNCCEKTPQISATLLINKIMEKMEKKK